MIRFVLQQNIQRFQDLLKSESDPQAQATLRGLLASARRELALVDVDRQGVLDRWTEAALGAEAAVEIVDNLAREERPVALLNPGPGLHIVDMNEAYARVTMTDIASVAGCKLFDVFPDNPADPAADGVSNLHASLRTVVETGRPHAMPLQRHDIRDGNGQFVERYWRQVNRPGFDAKGGLIILIHQIEDVTAEVLASQA